MSATRAQRRAEILDLLAEAGLALALDLKDAALAAEAADDKARLGAEFHRVSRGVRQSLALEDRFERSAQKAARELEADHVARGEAAVRARKAQVRACVERGIYQEHEGYEARVQLEDLTDRLDDEALFDGFTDEAVEAHIARLAADVGLTGEARVAYAPRALRHTSEVRPSGIDWGQFFDDTDEAGDEEGDDEADDDEGGDDEGGDFEDEDDEVEADGQGDVDPPPPPIPPPAAPIRTEPVLTDPDPPPPPPPDPPPKPYIPPWEQLRPGERFPGGSGW